MRASCSMRSTTWAGRMYVDHMYPRTLMTVENFTRHWKDKSHGGDQSLTPWT